MTLETQALLPQRHKLTYRQIYDAVSHHVFSTLNELGTVHGITYSYAAMFRCDTSENTECLQNSNVFAFYAGLCTAYVTLILKYLGEKFNAAPQRQRVKIINTIISQFMQVLNLHNFALMAGNSIISSVMNTDNIPNKLFWTAVFLPVLALTFLSPPPYIRYKLREWCCHYLPHAERGWIMKFIDMISALIEGAATFIMTMSAISQIRDYATHHFKRNSPRSWTYSLPGKVARYSWGGAWGIGQAVLRSRWPAITSFDEIIMSQWPSTLQNLLGTMTLVMLTGLSISMLESTLHKGLISGLSLLLVALSVVMTIKSIMYQIHLNISARGSTDQGNFPSHIPTVRVEEITNTTIQTPQPNISIDVPTGEPQAPNIQRDPVAEQTTTDVPTKSQRLVSYIKHKVENFSYKGGHSLKDIIFHNSTETQPIPSLPSSTKLFTRANIEKRGVYTP